MLRECRLLICNDTGISHVAYFVSDLPKAIAFWHDFLGFDESYDLKKPGTDTVRIADGRVFVNDIPLHDDYVPVEFRSHDDWGPQVVQQGYYFVMGDHRNNSSDSRHWGSVPKKYIVGKVKVRWWPIQDARIF